MPENASELTLNVAGTLTTSSTAQREVTMDADVTDVVAVVGTAPTGADLLLDVTKNGTSLFSQFGAIAPGSAMASATGADTLYMEFTGNGQPDIRQGQTLLVQSEQMTVNGQPQGSSKVDNANAVYAIPVTRAANGTSAATHAAGVAVSPAKPRIAAGATKSALIENPPYATSGSGTVVPGDVLAVTVTQIGSSVAGADLAVTIELSPR